LLNFFLTDGGTSVYQFGRLNDNLQRQINIVDNVSMSRGTHQLKFGIDYRRLFPVISPAIYSQTAIFTSITQLTTGIPLSVTLVSDSSAREPVFTNLSVYGQDTWRANRRLTLTYGIRWEVNPPPSEKNGNDPAVVTGLDNPSTASLAPFGTPLYQTTYNNFAPRLGFAYQIFQHSGRETILRGGFGIFYDLGTGTAGGPFTSGQFPYGMTKSLGAVPFPLSAALAVPPTVNRTSPSNISVRPFDPSLKLPRTYEWNLSAEQSLGANQTVTVSYVGAAGRRLLRQESIISPNAIFSSMIVTRNAATSDYHAAQLQFQRRLSRGLQAVASYTWSKSLDNFSNDSAFNNTPVTKLDPQLDRGPSDFDIRHAFNAGLTYNIPAPAIGAVGKSILRSWAIDSIFTARSATPVNVTVTRNIGFTISPRPGSRHSSVPGGPDSAGRKAFQQHSSCRQYKAGWSILRPNRSPTRHSRAQRLAWISGLADGFRTSPSV
jgi:hypothetical protein